MTSLSVRTFAFGVLALLPLRVAGQTPSYDDSLKWARYQPGTLREYVRQKTPAALDGMPAKGTGFAVGARTPIRARVVFLGQTRPMPSTRTQMLGAWFRSQQMDSASVLALYKHEVLVRDGERRFWLPVQEETWANTQELWAPNRPIIVLVQAVGARVDNRIPDWVFLVMTVEPPPVTSLPAPVGWKSRPHSLFNGRDLSGWHVDVPAADSNVRVRNPFVVRNGMLVTLGEPRGHLITDSSYRDYRLEVEYRFPAAPGNAGVLVHASTPRALYGMFPRSIEVQMEHGNAGDFWCILEDIRVPDMERRRGPPAEWGTTQGKARRILNLTDSSEKPLGEWNTMVIEAVGRSIRVWVNGDLVNEGSNATADHGRIAVQSEGSEVEFRKLSLVPISRTPPERASPQVTAPTTRPAPPTRDPNTPGFVAAKELPDGSVPPSDADGNFVIGPTHTPALEMVAHEGVPRGAVHTFTMSSADSKIFPGIARDSGTFGTVSPTDPATLVVTTSHPAPYTRTVAVYVPAQYVPGTIAPFIVGTDGPDQSLFTALDNLIAEKRVPAMTAISIGNGSGDAQGSERALEYDTMSGLYAEFVETEVLPLVERQYKVKLTRNPEGRATMGGSSGGSAAFIMAWYHPELYHRVLTYSITAVNQQWPHRAETPHGAWEFHERLIPNSPAKPIRVWMEVGDRDFLNPNVMRDGMHDWVVASENMARVLAAKGYHYQFVFARNAGHVDRGVKQQTLPEALEWLWRGYR